MKAKSNDPAKYETMKHLFHIDDHDRPCEVGDTIMSVTGAWCDIAVIDYELETVGVFYWDKYLFGKDLIFIDPNEIECSFRNVEVSRGK